MKLSPIPIASENRTDPTSSLGNWDWLNTASIPHYALLALGEMEEWSVFLVSLTKALPNRTKGGNNLVSTTEPCLVEVDDWNRQLDLIGPKLKKEIFRKRDRQMPT